MVTNNDKDIVSGAGLPSVLIICTYFPPSNNTGARRPYYLARHLSDKGHQVSVLTSADQPASWHPDVQNIEIIRFPLTYLYRQVNWLQAGIVRLLNRSQPGMIHRFLRFVTDMFLPVNHSVRWDVGPADIEQLIGRKEIIIATGPNWDVLDLGAKIAANWNASFIPDQRDPWNAVIPGVAMGSINWHGSGISGYLRSWRMRRMEERILRSAQGITAASPAYLNNALAISGPKAAAVIYNGLLPMEQPLDHPNNERLTVLYAGRVYREQDWSMLIRVLDSIAEHHHAMASELSIHFQGIISDDTATLRELERCAVRTGMIEFNKETDRENLKRIGESADILLSVIAEGNSGQIPLKLIDYMAFGRPILLMGKTIGIQHELIQRTKTGTAVSDDHGLLQFLQKAHQRWRSGEPMDHHPDPEALEKLCMTEQMEAWRRFILDVHNRG